jgi:LuxR family maltose regulon positive regulatory protein
MNSDPAPVDARFAVPLATHVLNRPRLHARLCADVHHHPCALVTAPAGWGKTLLLGSWLADGGAGRAAVWVSLGPGENDPRAFWTCVATALVPVVGEPAAAALRHLGDEEVESIPGRVAAVLAGDGTPVVLVLDDLHEITSLAVHESLLRLVRRPPPGVRFVVGTRRDPPWPLHRLRLAGLVTQIRALDLAFRADEAAALLAGSGVDLDEVHLQRLVRRTEGWAAGLRLAALELAHSDDPAGFVDRFSGNDHAVAAYLVSEVIDRLPPQLLDFLVRVSILDVVCADLAAELTDAGAGAGAATLAELAASNLFVAAVGAGGRWYRLHRLVRDVLRARITDPRRRRDLHRRAAQWYLRQSMPLDAVTYALRGGLWGLAAELLGVHVMSLLTRSSPRELERILSAVPTDELRGRPELATALAGARIIQGSGAQVGELLAAARAGVGRLPTRRAQRVTVLLDLAEIGYCRFRGDLTGLAAIARRVPEDPGVLAGTGLAAWDLVRLFVLGNTGTALLWTGDLARAEPRLRAAADSGRDDGVLRPHLNAAAHLTLLQGERGQLDAAEANALAVVARAAAAGWADAVQAVTAYLTLAWVALDRDEGARVDHWLTHVAEAGNAAEPHVQLAAGTLAALRRADREGFESALVALRSARARWAPFAPAALADRVLLAEADLLRRAGDVDQAMESLRRLRGPPTPHSAHAFARLYLDAGDREAAEQALAAPPPGPTTIRQQVQGGVVRALVAADTDPVAALRALEDALLAAAPVAMRRPFLVESAGLRTLLARRLEAGTGVAAFTVDLSGRMSGAPRAPVTPPARLVEDLTERERVVLRYLASTLSNAEIAAELYLSVNTVKSHQRMVYRKLGATGRRDAVRRARQRGLL